jgi:hypothetical protein
MWDYIVGSDLAYNEEGCKLLPRAVAALASMHTQVFYAHTKRRFEMLDYDFFSALADCSLTCTEVAEPWAPPAAVSPPAFSSLFPEMRIAVYRIAKRA